MTTTDQTEGISPALEAQAAPRRVRKLRHPKQRFNPTAALVWRRRTFFGARWVEVGEEVDPKLGAGKLRALWNSGRIELADFADPAARRPVTASEAKVELSVRGRGRYTLTISREGEPGIPMELHGLSKLMSRARGLGLVAPVEEALRELEARRAAEEEAQEGGPDAGADEDAPLGTEAGGGQALDGGGDVGSAASADSPAGPTIVKLDANGEPLHVPVPVPTDKKKPGPQRNRPGQLPPFAPDPEAPEAPPAP